MNTRSGPPRRRKRVVVVVGATSGIGRATGLALAEDGADLVLAARDGAELEAVARACEQRGAAVLVRPTDVAEAAQVQALADAAVERFGGFDAWVNMAGVLHFGRIEETSPEVLTRVVQVNLCGHLYGAQAALRQFRRQRRGVLVNVSSVLGVVGQPLASAYVATKFAIRGLSESLRQEVRDVPDIHVCTLLPSAVDTPIYQRAANVTGRALQPIRMLYPPEQVAADCVALLRRPRREAYGGKAFGAATSVSKALAPGMTERVTGAATRLMEVSPQAQAPMDGNLFAPLHDQHRIDGGWRRKYRADAARAAAGPAGVAALGLAGAGLLFGLLRLAGGREARGAAE